MDGAGVSVESVRDVEDLERIPITTKADLQEQPPERIVHRGFDRERLSVERSSGSTGRPFDVLYDADFRAVRDSLFLRSLATAGYRFGNKLLLVVGPRPKSRSRRWLRWRYASILDSPEELYDAFASQRPDFVYGCVTPLRMLAEELSTRPALRFRPRGLVATAESLDAQTRRLFESTFRCEVFEFYGMTEMGVVGWECAAHRGYHLSEDSSILEAIPAGDGSGHRRLILTNLELLAMPFIRFDSGDLGALEPDTSCSCGRSLTRLGRIEGRDVDCIRLRDGRSVSPYRLTCAFEKLPGVRRYQIRQRDHDSLAVRVEARDGTGDDIESGIRRALASLVGPEVRVTVERTARLRTRPGAKFRVVESALAD
jgi:phenylacetate-CoA ligase